MTNLLTYLKEQGLTHAEAIEKLESLNQQGQEPPADPPVPPAGEDPPKEEPEPQDPEPDPEIEKAVKEELEKAEKEELEKKKKELEEFNKRVAAEVRKQLSTKRKTPSKGEVNDGSKLTPESIKKNWFEKIV